MKIKEYLTIVLAGCVVVLLLASSPAAAGGKGMGPKRKVDIQAHFHPPYILNDIIAEVTGETAGYGWFLISNQTETYMQTFTIEERLAWMDQFGIEKSVFSFPSAYLFMRNEQEQWAERQEIARRINNYFYDLHEMYPERAFFMANVALSVATTPDRVEFCINELCRAIEELGLHAVCIPTNVAGMPLSDPLLEPFFEEVERLEIPLYIHPESPYCIEKLMNYGLFGRVGFPNDQALMIGNLIYSQNPDSGLNFVDHHPNLKIILTHLGGGLPYFYARLDLLPMYPHLKKLPSEYLKDFYYDTAIGNSLALEFLIKFLGSADRIMFGTDHPYVDSAEVNTIDFIQETCLTKRERKKIYFMNAEGLFGIGNKKKRER